MNEIDPKTTNRALAFELWMKAPMPMITLFKTIDVKNLIKISYKNNLKFNMLMCWCIGSAASKIEEFYLLPVGEKLMQYDKIGINTVVSTIDNSINTCDIPYSDDLKKFNSDYLELTKQVQKTNETHNIGNDYMVLGTSALAKYEIDGAVNLYAGFYNNPFMIWGRYRKKFLKIDLPVSFQFHHTQMDGGSAAEFLSSLQKVILELKI